MITNNDLKPHFRNMIKQRGGMFAKGFLFGVQFGAYFKDGLWLEMARHAVSQAQRIAKAAEEKGYTLYAKSPTNQVFIVLSHEKIAELEKKFAFGRSATWMTSTRRCALSVRGRRKRRVSTR